MMRSTENKPRRRHCATTCRHAPSHRADAPTCTPAGRRTPIRLRNVPHCLPLFSDYLTRSVGVMQHQRTPAHEAEREQMRLPWQARALPGQPYGLRRTPQRAGCHTPVRCAARSARHRSCGRLESTSLFPSPGRGRSANKLPTLGQRAVPPRPPRQGQAAARCCAALTRSHRRQRLSDLGDPRADEPPYARTGT